jgi:hypothetical protein
MVIETRGETVEVDGKDWIQQLPEMLFSGLL